MTTPRSRSEIAAPPLKFSCRQCGQRISATEEFSGSESACPECGELLLVPIFQDRAHYSTSQTVFLSSFAAIAETVFLISVTMGCLLIELILGIPLSWLALLAGSLLVLFGVRGFSPRGLPLYSSRNIVGRPARAIGLFTMLFGLAIILLPGVLDLYGIDASAPSAFLLFAAH